MKINVVKNASRNIFYASLARMYKTIVPFFMRTILIYSLGIEYAGVNGLFISILNVLSLSELGAGVTIVYFMYRSIALDDTQRINALMVLYKTYYRVIGLVVLVLGLILTPFLGSLISQDVPSSMNIYILYLMNLGATAFSYWLFAYKNALLYAHQRADVINRVDMVVSTLQYIGQFIVLVFLKNYYLYIGISLVMVLLKNIVTHYITKQMYPHYEASGNLEKEDKKAINSHIKDMLYSKFGGVVVNSVDAIVISAVLGIRVLGIYQNYYIIVMAVMGFVSIIYLSSVAGIGNKLITDSTGSVYENYKRFTFLIVWINGFAISSFLGLFQPFITLWVGEEMLLSYTMVILFSVFFYVFTIMALSSSYEYAAGVWNHDRFRPLLEALVNLTLNLILVHVIGLYGILISTIISMAFFSYPWLLYNIFRHVFKRSLKEFVINLTRYSLAVFIVILITTLVCFAMPFTSTITLLLVRIPICILLPNLMLYFMYRKSDELSWVLSIVKRVLLIDASIEKEG